MRYWEIIGENLKQGVGIAVLSQVRITKGDNFGLWPQSVRTTDALHADEKLTAFLELEAHLLGRFVGEFCGSDFYRKCKRLIESCPEQRLNLGEILVR